MINNNENNFSCQFAEQVVLYLYGESNAKDKIKFESHLGNCMQCTKELADFGFVRTALNDWRMETFSNFETLSVKIPDVPLAVNPTIETVSVNSGSWLDGLRKLFYFNPAMAALAILFFGIGVSFYLYNYSIENEIAAIEDTTSTQINVTPTVEVRKNTDESNLFEVKKSEISTSAPSVNSYSKIKSEKQISAGKSVSRISLNFTKNPVGASPVISKKSNASVRKATTIKKPQIPNLDNDDEVEDKSIRLADLFDELDTK